MPYHSDITNVVNQTSHGERKLQSNDTVLTTPLPRTRNQGRTQHLVCLRNMVLQTRNKFICTMPDQCEHVWLSVLRRGFATGPQHAKSFRNPRSACNAMRYQT